MEQIISLVTSEVNTKHQTQEPLALYSVAAVQTADPPCLLHSLHHLSLFHDKLGFSP